MASLHGRGAVFRRSGGWAYRVDAGFHPETGKRRQTLKQGFATKKAAEAALAETLRDRSMGMAVARSTVRVEEFLKKWWETARLKLRPTTYYGYARSVDKINRHLGRYQLQSLTQLQIERFYADLLAGGGRDGGRVVGQVGAQRPRRAAQGAVRRGAPRAGSPQSGRRCSATVAVRPELVTWSSDDLRIRLHDLRHTYATLALKVGVHPKVVSERLGHATVGVTLDLYSHVGPSIAATPPTSSPAASSTPQKVDV